MQSSARIPAGRFRRNCRLVVDLEGSTRLRDGIRPPTRLHSVCARDVPSREKPMTYAIQRIEEQAREVEQWRNDHLAAMAILDTEMLCADLDALFKKCALLLGAVERSDWPKDQRPEAMRVLRFAFEVLAAVVPGVIKRARMLGIDDYDTVIGTRRLEQIRDYIDETALPVLDGELPPSPPSLTSERIERSRRSTAEGRVRPLSDLLGGR